MSTVDLTLSFEHQMKNQLIEMTNAMGGEAAVYLAKQWIDEFLCDVKTGGHPDFEDVKMILPELPDADKIRLQQMIGGYVH